MSNSRFPVIAATVVLTMSAIGCGEPATETAPPRLETGRRPTLGVIAARHDTLAVVP